MTLRSHWADDVPAEPEHVAMDLPEDADLALFTAVEGTLTDPLGEEVDLTGAFFTLDAVERTVEVEWGTPTRFISPGVYSLQLILVGAGTIRQRLAPERIVVEEISGWHTLASAREQWTDAPYEDVQLYELLDIAGGQCVAFAPALLLGAAVPKDHRLAQLMQARNLWNASKVSPSGDLGDGTYVITPKPLDWHVKQLLRPKRAVPVMF
jgi:hypothetical protein